MKTIPRPQLEIHPGANSRLLCRPAGESLPLWQREFAGSVQAAYLDPPFLSGGVYRQQLRIGAEGWQGQADHILEQPSFSDRWPGGPPEYFALLEQALSGLRELLREDGCLILHVDWRTAAPLRLMLDRIFGADHFVNEIIWHYYSGGRTQTHFARKHDNIFLYKKGRTFFFDPEFAGTPRGAKRRNHLRRSVDEHGKVYFSIISAGKEYRYYEDDLIYPGDVWSDIPHLQQRDPERTGYDTQKPEALLERLLLTTTRPGDRVCDPFSGSGTAAAVALAHGRLALAADVNPRAVQLIRRRMAAAGGGFTADLTGLPEGEPADAALTHGDGLVRLERFILPGAEKYQAPSLLPQQDAAVDYWSVGRLEGDRYTVHAYEMRTAKAPYLAAALPLPPGGATAAHVVDGLGGEHWYLLE